MELKIGGYRNSDPSSPGDLDLTPKESEVIETPIDEPTVEAVVETPVSEVPQETINTPEVITEELPVDEGYTYPVKITDEILLSTLSEKLGKEVKSLSDLIPEQRDPLADDPYLKTLAEWRKTTGRPIEDWVKYQKDYTQMADVEVVREFLQHKYPNFTSDEIDFKVSELIPDSELDDDREIFKKNLSLKELAHEGRNVLNSMKSELGQPGNLNLPEEVKADLELAKQVKEQAVNEQHFRENYSTSIKNVSNTMDKFKIQLNENLAIDYSISDKDRSELPQFIDTMPHWRNSDGTWNHKAVVEDGIKIKFFDELIKAAYNQGVNSGKEDAIKTANNITLDSPNPASANLPKTSNVIIEGLDKYIGSDGTKIRFGK